MAAVASASAPPVPAAPSSNLAGRFPHSFLSSPIRARRPVVLGSGSSRGRFRAEATQREKVRQGETVVEESFPVREAAEGPPEAVALTDDDDWVVRLEQSFNIFLTDFIIAILDLLYRDRDYARFFVLETIARVPYFAFISVLHLYETFGWSRKADYIKVHFAESMNEFHHLLIMEELGGNSEWIDRFLARFSAVFYYFIAVGMYMLSPRMAYHFSECVERHAYSTYDKFLKVNGDQLIKLPAPEAAINYYMNEDLYLFDEFQTSRAPSSRRPKVDNLYDVFVNIRDDEAEHCKTMAACQTPGSIRSPHSTESRTETDVKKSLANED
ncbi:ubiquinol oxidase 4, chloroplastic/chromoplastic isoform X1 [Lolium perenne]|uniref:ubiquinol oxidase 4, chloroplastic/chromoplastic isoform X1 n=1 Tax=Lolium perenne TaxID=4522 RepID=UPI0021F50793|nr:ubiquinol oxidase 4, chloroplastic/chromoplastic-like [Lolium perenne]